MINRFEWLKAVLKSDLPDRAKVLASTLAVQFCNDETGQMNPGLATLAAYMSTSEDTVRRGLADLAGAGWLTKTTGQGRGHRSNYTLTSPGNVVSIRPVAQAKSRQNVAAKSTKKRSQDCKLKPRGKGRKTAAKRSQDCNPLYNDQQSIEQKRQARPAGHLMAHIPFGSWKALEWNTWLSDHGQPQLAELPSLLAAGGYILPWSTPPKSTDKTATLIAKSVIDWAKEQRNERAA